MNYNGNILQAVLNTTVDAVIVIDSDCEVLASRSARRIGLA
ncbi:MAG: hypothetical protein N2C14_20050 [Planctomycetales bacterium]